MGIDLNTLSAKELKVIAEKNGLVKGEDFQANASKNDMLELLVDKDITVTDNDDNSDDADAIINDTVGKDNAYEVVTPVKRDGKILVQGDSIKYFKGIEKLIENGIVKES